MQRREAIYLSTLLWFGLDGSGTWEFGFLGAESEMIIRILLIGIHVRIGGVVLLLSGSWGLGTEVVVYKSFAAQRERLER